MSVPLKSPLPTPDENDAAYVFVCNGIDTAYPVAATPPPVYGGYPSPQSVYQSFSYQGVTQEAILASFLTGLSYYGAPADYETNARLRNYLTGEYGLDSLVAMCFAQGIPLTPAIVAPPTPLVATFSQSAIETRAAQNPPMKYSGALAYNAADAHIWEPQVATSITNMMANPDWIAVFDQKTMTLLAKNMAGKGLPYEIPGPLPQYTGLNAAQTLRIADPTTLPGVPATA